MEVSSEEISRTNLERNLGGPSRRCAELTGFRLALSRSSIDLKDMNPQFDWHDLSYCNLTLFARLRTGPKAKGRGMG